MNKHVSKNKKRCKKCDRFFFPSGNRQIACSECKPKLKQLPIRPARSQIDVMLDQADFARARARAKDGWANS